MSNCRRPTLIALAVLAMATVSVAALTTMLPNSVSVLSYAVEGDSNQAGNEQLTEAQDLTRAFQEVTKALRPSVVSIGSVKRIKPAVKGPDNEFRQWPEEFRRFFGDDMFDRHFQFRMPERGFEQRGLGTGVIVSDDGYILTNNHVVADADEVEVTLSDERRFKADVVGSDAKTDLAVLKIETEDLVPAELGNSDTIEVGQWVLAVGSPFGLQQTVTAGIVSAKGRANMGIADYEDFIQTDAAINPGNSGGPLVNLDGEVIGINTAIASRTGGYMGIGFAIPCNMVRQIMNSIITTGHVDRGWLGAMIQDLTDDLARSFEYESTDGVLIGDVVPDGPANKAGLRAGDIVVEYNGEPVRKAAQLRNAVAATAPDSEVELAIFRDGKRKTLEVNIGLLEGQAVAGETPESALELGMAVQTITPDLARQAGVEEDEKGVVVTEVEPGSIAARAGIRIGDVIVAVGGSLIANTTDFRNATSEQDLKEGIRMQVKREGMRRFAFLKSS